MITCPYCGTHYVTFQPNCTNCGGPLPLPPDPDAPQPPDILSASPPLPPRPISDRYVWKLLWADGWAVAGLVFFIIGSVFGILGIILTIIVITAFVGIPFAILGLLFFCIGLGTLIGRYYLKTKVVEVLRNGQAVQGEIESVTVNRAVEVNGANPWTIGYRFRAQGAELHGKVTTLTPPDASLREGLPTWVLYLPDSPVNNVMYPHP
jgi:hypothetical protein